MSGQKKQLQRMADILRGELEQLVRQALNKRLGTSEFGSIVRNTARLVGLANNLMANNEQVAAVFADPRFRRLNIRSGDRLNWMLEVIANAHYTVARERLVTDL